MIARGRAIAMDAFNESDHPRDGGKFTSGGGNKGGGKQLSKSEKKGAGGLFKAHQREQDNSGLGENIRKAKAALQAMEAQPHTASGDYKVKQYAANLIGPGMMECTRKRCVEAVRGFAEGDAKTARIMAERSRKSANNGRWSGKGPRPSAGTFLKHMVGIEDE